jgi:rhodanese-related sulfurtransferase
MGGLAGTAHPERTGYALGFSCYANEGTTMKPGLGHTLMAIAPGTLGGAGAAPLVAAIPASVDAQQGAALQSQGALLLDVREAYEYEQGHAPGSTLIPLGQLEQRLQEISSYKDKPVALICRSGQRSGVAQKLLKIAGFSATANLEGGIIAWQRAGLPVVAGSASR